MKTLLVLAAALALTACSREADIRQAIDALESQCAEPLGLEITISGGLTGNELAVRCNRLKEKQDDRR